MTCAQCGDTTGELSESAHGPLCPRCAYRQAQHDQARDRFDHLTPSSLGFLPDDE
ncbi:MAG: hypothetical protein ACR2P2_10985 [Nakamurella sp.]